MLNVQATTITKKESFNTGDLQSSTFLVHNIFEPNVAMLVIMKVFMNTIFRTTQFFIESNLKKIM